MADRDWTMVQDYLHVIADRFARLQLARSLYPDFSTLLLHKGLIITPLHTHEFMQRVWEDL